MRSPSAPPPFPGAAPGGNLRVRRKSRPGHAGQLREAPDGQADHSAPTNPSGLADAPGGEWSFALRLRAQTAGPGSERSRRSGRWPTSGWLPPRSALWVRWRAVASMKLGPRGRRGVLGTPGPSPARSQRSLGGGRTARRRSLSGSAFFRGAERRLRGLASSQPCRRRRVLGCGAVAARGRELGSLPRPPRTRPASRTRSSGCAPDSGSGCPWG